MASFFIHTIIPNPYIGIFILIFGWIGVSALPNTVTDHPLVLFNFNDLISYSDISGYGNVLPGFLLNKAYWTAFGFLLLIASYLLWNRGKYDKYSDITRHLKNRWKRPIPLFSIIGLVSFLTLGYFVLDGENKKSTTATNVHQYDNGYFSGRKQF